MRVYIVLLIVSFNFGLAGCRYIVTPLPDLIPAPPEAASTPAKIVNLRIAPNQVKAGVATTINLTFDYEDFNADVGPNVTQVEIQSSVISGNFDLNTALSQVSGTVMQDDAHWGRRGRVSFTQTFNVPASASGIVGVSITLLDGANQRSNTLSGQINVIASETGGGVGPGGHRCTIIDGNKNPVTTVKIGRQVFFRMIDPDNNFSSDRQDRLFRAAAFQGGSSGDVEVIVWMLETGVNTGVFEGPPGGLLLTSRFPISNNGELSVLDNDTVMAIYEDPNGPGDVCIAIAKVR